MPNTILTIPEELEPQIQEEMNNLKMTSKADLIVRMIRYYFENKKEE